MHFLSLNAEQHAAINNLAGALAHARPLAERLSSAERTIAIGNAVLGVLRAYGQARPDLRQDMIIAGRTSEYGGKRSALGAIHPRLDSIMGADVRIRQTAELALLLESLVTLSEARAAVCARGALLAHVPMAFSQMGGLEPLHVAKELADGARAGLADSTFANCLFLADGSAVGLDVTWAMDAYEQAKSMVERPVQSNVAYLNDRRVAVAAAA